MRLTKQEAIKFLMQSTCGFEPELVDKVALIGKESWLDQQMAMPMKDSTEGKVHNIWEYFKKKHIKAWGKNKIVGNEQVLPYWLYWRMAWWDTNLKTEEYLRHRIAIALSEILVISDKSVLELNSFGLSNYYDLLYKYAFGNYEELLYKVSLHPCMGVYLSHLNNPKEDKANNIHPDENYAREIMQLFSIGLYELNIDGTRKMNSNGKPIATYDNNDIKEVARVFTGLGPGAYWWPWEDYSGYPVQWGAKENKVPNIDMTKPMQAFEAYHDRGEKEILKKYSLPSGQDALEEIKEVVRILVSEQNTAVYVSKRLIQSLTTSNPSKAYVKAVAQVFMDNGKGVIGDLKAVVKAILLHKEANEGVKMKEPMLRATQVLRAFNAHNKSNKLWATGLFIEDYFNQHPLSAPSVFNFFLSDYAPHGDIEKTGLVAPEFQMMNAATSIGYVNAMYSFFFSKNYLMVSTQASSTRFDVPEVDYTKLKSEDKVKLDLKKEEALAKESPSKLIDHLDMLLTGGTLNPQTKSDILEAVSPFTFRPDWVVETALFMITISPDYTIIS
jgi:uncharacterized protein (DUF1800 family)